MRLLTIVALFALACGASKAPPPYPESNDPSVDEDFELMELEEEVADEESE